MPDVDIQETVTRKIGPLPAWGWGLAIVGAVVVFRIVGGRSANSTVSESTPTMVGAGATDIPADGTFDGASSLVGQILRDIGAQQTLIDQLQTSAANLSSFQELQARLTNAINQKAILTPKINHEENYLNYVNDNLRLCKTDACKTLWSQRATDSNERRAKLQASVTVYDNLIKQLQQQMQGAA